jgi:DNA-binding response OmpR family regulator
MKRLKPLVLVIDDDPIFRKSMEAILARFGINVKGVGQSQEFIDAAAKFSADLYLIDLHLGDSSGFDLIKYLRKTVFDTKPILILSGENNPTAVPHALELGANDFILKPLDGKLLASKLFRYFKTDEIEDRRSILQELSSGRSAARISFDGEITAIDELGIKLKSKTMIPKGTSFKISNELFKEFGAQDSQLLVTVSQNWVESDTSLYGIYGEFERTDGEFRQALRRWLAQTE